MWRKLVLVIALLSVVPLGHGALAQAGELHVWSALAEEDVSVIEDATRAFADGLGARADVRVVEAPYLLQAVIAAREAGEPGPDVIFAPTDIAEPLVENALILPRPSRGEFFLAALLEALPGLFNNACGGGPPEGCLWEPVNPALPPVQFDERAMARTMGWMCESAPDLTMCGGNPLAGQPVTWGYQIILLNRQWLAERGLEPPVLLDDVLAIRSEFGLDILVAEPGALPMPGNVPPAAIVIIPSAVLVQQPEETLRSMGSFFAADYAPVLGLTFDTLYVGAGSVNPDLAAEFANVAAQESAFKAGLLHSSGRLPAFTGDGLVQWGLDRPEARAVLQALVVLAIYAQTVY
ncbi:MAG: hypothetical protein OZ934_02845 [Anaerolineae bacterium]|nr:hypothetical protein [Anaerolineae bacterium]